MVKKIITVEGMHCSHCASTVERVVGEIEGVTSAKVNLDKKTCTAKINCEIDDSAFKTAIKDAGFEVISVETKKSLF